MLPSTTPISEADSQTEIVFSVRCRCHNKTSNSIVSSATTRTYAVKTSICWNAPTSMLSLLVTLQGQELSER